MRRHATPSLLVLLLVVAAATLPAATTQGAAVSEPTSAEVATDVIPEPGDDERAMRGELADLADAWAIGGGSFGYPFWDKAAQRWRAHEISTPLFREYVTGYRDRLVVGCGLIDDVEADSDTASGVQELLADACEDRVEGLRGQRRWLDELISGEIAATAEVDRAERDARIATLEQELGERFDRSFRDTRRAMNLAQAELDAHGLDRLPEDAFV